MLIEGATVLSTVMMMVLLVAVAGLIQVELPVIVSFTWLPVASAAELNTGLLDPVLLPFTCH